MGEPVQLSMDEPVAAASSDDEFVANESYPESSELQHEAIGNECLSSLIQALVELKIDEGTSGMEHQSSGAAAHEDPLTGLVQLSSDVPQKKTNSRSKKAKVAPCAFQNLAFDKAGPHQAK